MKQPSRTVALVLLLGITAGCTNEVKIPDFAGPSTLGYSILLTASPDAIIQDGVSSTTITITARDEAGQPIVGRPLRAEIQVDGITQDYGSLNTKSPVTGSTLRYTAPPPSAIAAGQVTQFVTVAVIPTDQGDAANTVSLGRQVQIRLIPQGVILPNNPNLVASFTMTPTSPPAFTTTVFDATASTNGGAPCGIGCSYAWNFGDGTSGSGMTTTHQYRSVGTFQATLTVTDFRGAQANLTRSVTVTPATPPSSVTISVSPTGGATVNQDLFFTAQALPAAGRTIARYDWTFGDGESSSGGSTTHRYRTTGSFLVNVVATDDVGAEGRASTTVTVGTGTPTGAMTFLPSAPRVNQPVTFNASAITPAQGATIVSYRFNYGDGSPAETGTQAFQSHVYTGAATFVATVTVTDSLGRTATSSVSVPVIP